MRRNKKKNVNVDLKMHDIFVIQIYVSIKQQTRKYEEVKQISEEKVKGTV